MNVVSNFWDAWRDMLNCSTTCPQKLSLWCPDSRNRCFSSAYSEGRHENLNPLLTLTFNPVPECGLGFAGRASCYYGKSPTAPPSRFRVILGFDWQCAIITMDMTRAMHASSIPTITPRNTRSKIIFGMLTPDISCCWQ